MPGNDIVVQGSRAAEIANRASDIDIGIRVDASNFDSYIQQSFGSPNPGSANEGTMLHAIRVGKITAGRSFDKADLRSLRTMLQKMLGIDVDISIIKKGGLFDSNPNIPVE
jgi:hypothetical protein